MIDLTLVEVANGEYDARIKRQDTIRKNSVEKARQYHRRTIVKNILTYLAILSVFIIVGIIGNIELHAEPEYKAQYEEEQLYPTTGIVTTVAKDFMVFTDFNGNQWEVKGDPEDWAVGDICAAIMSDNGTVIIYDDKVKATKYCGWAY